NYLLACRTCNSNYKGNKFPLVAGQSRVRFETRGTIAEEARLLLDPCLDQIHQLVKVDASNILLPVVPNDGLPAAIEVRVRETLKFFGINEQPELTKARKRMASKVLKAIQSKRPEKVRGLAIRYRPNAFVARQLLAGHAPHVLPTPAEEVEWLLRDMFR